MNTAANPGRTLADHCLYREVAIVARRHGDEIASRHAHDLCATYREREGGSDLTPYADYIMSDGSILSYDERGWTTS